MSDPAAAGVSQQACLACCRCVKPGEELNPVVASLVYSAAGAIFRAGGMPGCDKESALALKERIVSHLGLVAPGLPDRIFPPEAVPLAAPESRSGGLTRAERSTQPLVVGLLTAPRERPLLRATLRSLDAAGFGRLWIFAEPGSPIPPEARRHEIEIQEHRLGNFTSFYNALASLYRKAPEARGVILFQDDIEVAAGLKDWCDRELFPAEHGLVSLFTPRLHADTHPGWRALSPGFFRIWGGQALAFRRDVLAQFLTDPQVLREIRTGRSGDDAIVSGWATRRSLSIAFHSPSLVQHVGRISALWGRQGPDGRVVAHAVKHVDQIPAWRPPLWRPGKVGLVGSGGATGLGYQNADFARRYEIDRWLMPVDSSAAGSTAAGVKCRIVNVPADIDRRALRQSLAGLDWIVFIEHPLSNGLARTARSLGISIAAVVNWEWLSPNLDWLRIADVLICPTKFTYHYVCDWRKRFGFGWDAVHLPWPVDFEGFPFRERRRCERFVFVNGRGGLRGTRLDGSKTSSGRKGMEIMVEAMKAAPRLKFLVFSQARDLPGLPSNAELLGPQEQRVQLYDQGDVCVQPSHLEGLGLPLLECQAAGMPLVTTDAPPMNEHNPWMRIPVTGAETVFYGLGEPVPWQQMDPWRLAGLLEEVAGSDITEASRQAREFVETEHNWARAAAQLRQILVVR